MTMTLFGGMLLIAVLFFALGLARLPAFWRGIISGALPSLGIILQSFAHWPGGDVIAIHIALYIATATVLTLAFGGKRKARLHWAPVAIVVFFVLLSGLMAGFLSIANQGLPPSLAKLLLPASQRPVYTAFSGEVPHDEEAAKAISHQLKKAHQQKALGWQLTVDGLDDMPTSEPRLVSVEIVDAAKHPLDGASVQITLTRPGARQTGKTWTFPASGSGRYQASISMQDTGQWIAILTVTRGQDKFETAKEILVLNPRQ